MALNTLELVVFDMAGTTIEDSGQVMAAFTAALRVNQVSATEEEIQSWRGASKREVLRHFVERQFGRDDPDNATRIERAYAEFRRCLERAYRTQGAHAIDGADRTFTWLRERGVKIALTTGFYRQVTEIILEATGWGQGAVDATICSDEVPQGRPAPYMIFRAMELTGVIDVRRVVKVGDTALDLLAGTNAGARGVVGVLSGSQTIEQLGSVAHTHIIPSVADLPRLLRRMQHDADHQSQNRQH
jgi:phosphonatase-like hydrolase